MDDPRYHTIRWQKLRIQIIRRDGGCTIKDCTYDTSGLRKLHVDHIVELSDGGSFWDPANLATLCQPHHGAKTLNVVAARSHAEPISPNA